MKLKLLLFILVVIIQNNLFAQISKKNNYMEIIDNSTIQKIIEVNYSKEEIYSKLKKYIPVLFTEKDSIINYHDNDYIIDGDTNLILYLEEYSNGIYKYRTENKRIYFKYIIEIKDNKFRLTIKNPYWFRINPKGGEAVEEFGTDNFFISFIKALQKMKLIENMTKSISNEKNNNNTW